MGLDYFTLLAANAITLVVMAAAFLAAWLGRFHEPYWPSWILANLALAAALLVFMYDGHLPIWLAATGSNGLLILGFGLRWQAARLFAGRRAEILPTLGPVALFLLLCALPGIMEHEGRFFALVNVILSAQTFAIAHEFWRDREDRLPSRYGLVATYSIMGLSFGARVIQGVFFFDGIPFLFPHDTMLELHLLVALLVTAGTGAFILSIAYERSATSLREAAMRDPLTGLYNRRAFEEHIRRYLAGREPEPFSLVLFDIDHFKSINDRYGHLAGDAALRACARICAASLRRSDTVARIGGEEFAALLPRTGPDEAYEIADRVRQAVAGSTIACGEGSVKVTVSAGLCHGVIGDCSFDKLMREADEHLYQAKTDGRDRVARPDGGLPPVAAADLQPSAA